jgi:hypothetical protein
MLKVLGMDVVAPRCLLPVGEECRKQSESSSAGGGKLRRRRVLHSAAAHSDAFAFRDAFVSDITGTGEATESSTEQESARRQLRYPAYRRTVLVGTDGAAEAFYAVASEPVAPGARGRRLADRSALPAAMQNIAATAPVGGVAGYRALYGELMDELELRADGPEGRSLQMSTPPSQGGASIAKPGCLAGSRQLWGKTMNLFFWSRSFLVVYFPPIILEITVRAGESQRRGRAEKWEGGMVVTA